jgi:ureidoacrylate peracid hydrolase
LEAAMELGSARGNQWQIGDDAIDLSRERRPARRVRIEARAKPVIVDLAAAAMIVIDMQNRFCHEKYASPGEALPTTKPIAPLQALLPHLREAGVPIIWLNWGNRPDKLNLSPGVLRPFHRTGGPTPPILDKGSWDAEIVAPLAAEPGDIHVDKYRISGFWDTPLDSILRNLSVRTLFFAGVNLDQCVYATLLDAGCLGYDCVLIEDCTATRSPDFCAQGTLYNVERGTGFVVTSSDVRAAPVV